MMGCSEQRFEDSVVEKPDLLVSDIMMPKLNGLELLLYAKNEGYKHTKIIGMTSGFSSYLDSLLPEKFDLLLTKPIDLDYLLKLIREEL
ncbi:response regulator [archaeon]|nr:MAG: response regulator [archaeon]